MEIKSIHDDAVYQEVRDRLDRLEPDSDRRWGKMTPAQMLGHCAEIQEVLNGTRDLTGVPRIAKLLKPVIKWFILRKKPYPKNVGTAPQYEVTDDLDFEKQKQRLIDALEKLRREGKDGSTHPLMGDLTPDEAGWMTYKHLDHHLRQFGV